MVVDINKAHSSLFIIVQDIPKISNLKLIDLNDFILIIWKENHII